MNYKEKYKRAFEKAKKLYGKYCINNVLEDLFPELSESKDERIRKGIIRNLQYLMDRSEGFVKEDLQERIAWLDKQGEKDPCIGCTNDKGCVTCENGNLKEIKIEPKTLDADEVIEWIRENIPIYGNYVMIDRFKKDFG